MRNLSLLRKSAVLIALVILVVGLTACGGESYECKLEAYGFQTGDFIHR